MYEVGEYVVHPGQGVCVVESVANDKGTYQLTTVGQRNPVRISFPVSSESRLRPILSRDEAYQLIDDYDTMELDTSTGGSGVSEEEHFRQEIRRGSCRDTVRIVKTFRSRIADVKSRNKKPPVAYERILKQASQRSLSELSVALGVSTDDVLALFHEREDEAARQN